MDLQTLYRLYWFEEIMVLRTNEGGMACIDQKRNTYGFWGIVPEAHMDQPLNWKHIRFAGQDGILILEVMLTEEPGSCSIPLIDGRPLTSNGPDLYDWIRDANRMLATMREARATPG